MKRYMEEMERLRERRETTLRRIAELETQTQELCAGAGIQSTDLLSLDATCVLQRQMGACEVYGGPSLTCNSVGPRSNPDQVCWICGGQSGTRTVLIIFPCQYIFTNAPHSFIIEAI